MNTFCQKIKSINYRKYLISYLIPMLTLFCIRLLSHEDFPILGILLLPFSAISFLYFTEHASLLGNSSSLLALGFSWAYSLSSFGLANMNSLSSILLYILLPILCLSLDSFLSKGRFLPITLIFALLLCIEPVTACILFFYLIGFVIFIPECPIGQKIADLLHMLLLFVFALGLSAAFSIPQLQDFFTSVSENPYNGFSINYPWANFFARFLPGSVLSFFFSTGRGLDLYCGLLVFLGLILYFFNNNFPIKKRVRTLLYLLFVLLTIQTTPFQYLIELCNTTNTAYLYYSFFFFHGGINEGCNHGYRARQRRNNCRSKHSLCLCRSECR